MPKKSIFKPTEQKKREPLFKTDHKTVDDIEYDIQEHVNELILPDATDQYAEYTFVDTFMRDEESGVLPMLSLERPEEEELTEPVIDDTGSKKERKEKQRQYQIDKAKFEEARARRARENTYYSAASDEIAEKITKERVSDEYGGIQDTKIYSEEDEETTPYSWIKMKFTGEDYGTTEGGQQQQKEDKDAFYVQERIARSMTEARDIMSREQSKEQPDKDRLKIYDALSQRLVLISNSYVLNEREIKALSKIKQTETDAITESVKAKIAEGGSPDEVTANALMASAMEQRALLQKNLRHNLQLEIRKLTALLRRAELVTDEQGTWAAGEDLVYLEQIGVSSAMFNMLGWPEEVRRGDMTIAQAKEKYGDILHLEKGDKEKKDDEENRKVNDAAVNKELGAEFDHYDRESAEKEHLRRLEEKRRIEAKRLRDEQDAAEERRRLAEEQRLKDEAAEKERRRLAEEQRIKKAKEEFKAKIITEYAKSGTADERIDLVARAERDELYDETMKDVFDRLVRNAISDDIDRIAEDMNERLKDATGRIKEIKDQPGSKLSAKERIGYMKALDDTFREISAAREKIRDAEPSDDALTQHIQERRNELAQKRIEAYEAKKTEIAAIQEQYVMAKYNRSIARRTSTDRILPYSARDLKAKLDKAVLHKSEVAELQKALEGEEPLSAAQKTLLLTNLNVFLTGKMRDEIETSIKHLGDEKATLTDDDKAALHAASFYILTVEDVTSPTEKATATEDKKKLYEKLKEASSGTKDLLLEDLADYEKYLTYSGTGSEITREQREQALTIGERLSLLRSEAEKTLLEDDMTLFREKYDQASVAYAKFMQGVITGEKSDNPVMDKLLIESSLHPGVLQEYQKLTEQNRQKFITEMTATPERGVIALDSLMKDRHDLDRLCLILKTKALQGIFTGTTRELDTNDLRSLNASHDGSRLARACRDMIKGLALTMYKGPALAQRLDEIQKLDDEQLIIKTLTEDPKSEFSFLLINAYALLLSGRTGNPITTEVRTKETKKSISPGSLHRGPLKMLEKSVIRDALSSNMGSASDYSEMKDILSDEVDVYDSSSLGNKFKNAVGSVIGKDISRERMGLRVLQSLVQAPGHFDALEVQRTQLRELFDTNTANSFDATSSLTLEKAVERVKDADEEDYGHELAIAGARLTTRERLKERKEKLHRAEHLAYDSERAEDIESMLKSRALRSEPPASEDKKVPAPVAETEVSKVSSVAVAVLTIDTLMSEMERYLGDQDAAAIKGDSFKKKFAAYKKTADAVGKKLDSDTGGTNLLIKQTGGKYDLLSMSMDKDAHENEAVQEIRHRFKEAVRGVAKSESADEAKAAIQVYKALQEELGLVKRAEAALLLEQEFGHNEEGLSTIREYSKLVSGEINKSDSGGSESLYQRRLSASFHEVLYTYHSADAVRAELEAELTPAELLMNAREERIESQGGKDDENVKGATLALTVIAIGELAKAISSGQDIDGKAIDAYKNTFADLRKRLGTFFNLEAMVKEGVFNKQKGTHVQVVREKYKLLIDNLASAAGLDALKTAASELEKFYAENRLIDRADAALSMKDATQDFDEKLENATGLTAETTTGPLFEIKDRLTEDRAGKLGSDVMDRLDPIKALSDELKSRLVSVTEVAVMAAFRNVIGDVDFEKYIERLQDPESTEYKTLTQTLGTAFTDVKFIKKDTLGGADKGTEYSPLGRREGEKTEEPSMAGRLMAELMIGEFVSTVTGEAEKDKEGGVNKWLSDKAGKHISETSIMIDLLEDDQGKYAAAEFKEKIVVRGTIDQMLKNLGKDRVLTIKNYAGGSGGVTAIMDNVEAKIDIEAAVANDLTITRDMEGNLNVYVGGSAFGGLKASLGVDAGIIKAEGTAELSVTLATGMKLDFSDEDKCNEFLVMLFNGGNTAAGAMLDGGKNPALMLKQASRIAPIRSIGGKAGVGLSVGTGEDSNSIIGDNVKELLGSTPAGKLISDGIGVASEYAADKLSAIGDTVAGWAHGAADHIGPGLLSFAGKIIGAAPEGKSEEWGAVLAEKYAELNAKLDEVIEEQVKKSIEDLPDTISEKVSDSLKEKVSKKLEEKFDAEIEDDEEEEPSERFEKAKSKIESFLGEKLDEELLTQEEIDAVTKEEEEKEEATKNLIDAELAVKMSIAGKYQTERDKDTEKITTSVALNASAEASLTVAGAKMSKRKEGTFEAILEREYKGGELTDATMSRRYVLGADDAKNAKEILADFGTKNDALIDDLENEYAGVEGIVLIFDAKLSQSGMDKYSAALAEGAELKAMYILSDRSNYINPSVRIEVPVAKASAEAGVALRVKAKALGTGGELRAGYRTGADGSIYQIGRYSARSTKARR
jgi:hypothetical protein